MPKIAQDLFLVRAEERTRLLVLVGIFSLVGFGMAIGRGSAEALFFKRFGVEYLPQAYAALSPLLAIVALGYAAFTDRVAAERLFIRLITAGAIALAGCWTMMVFSSNAWVYPFYFITYEIGSELLLVHLSIYLLQNLHTQQSKRLSPLIFAGLQSGSICGGITLAWLAPRLGVQNMLLVWCAALVITGVLLARWHRGGNVSPFYRAPARQRHPLRHATQDLFQGFRLLRGSPLLIAVSLALFFMVITFYVLSYSVNSIYAERFATEESLSTFLGALTAATGTTALCLQFFVTSRLIRRFGVKAANLIFPVSCLASFVGLLGSYSLLPALLGSFSKDTIMPAFRNPVRAIFQNALPSNIQGRASAVSSAVVIPLALLVAGLFLLIVQRWAEPVHAVVIGLIAASLYLLSNLRMNLAYVTTLVDTLKSRLYLPEGLTTHPLNDPVVCQQIHAGLNSDNDALSYSYAKQALQLCRASATRAILQRATHASNTHRDRLLSLLDKTGQQLPPTLLDKIDAEDIRLRSTVLRLMFLQRQSEARPLVRDLLAEENPRLLATGILGVGAYGIDTLRQDATARWLELLRSEHLGACVAALTPMQLGWTWASMPDQLESSIQRCLAYLLESESPRARRRALACLASEAPPADGRVTRALLQCADDLDPNTRIACLDCHVAIPATEAQAMFERLLRDSHPKVRLAAARHSYPDLTTIPALLTRLRAQTDPPRSQQALLDHLLTLGADPAELSELAEMLGNVAVKMAAARHALLDLEHEPAVRLLTQVLKERMNQYLDNALAALAHSEDKTNIAVIRAGVRSNDVRNAAQACEVLVNLRHRGIARLLGMILETPADLSRTVEGTVADLHGAIEWCVSQNDEWLKKCSSHAQAILAESRHGYS